MKHLVIQTVDFKVHLLSNFPESIPELQCLKLLVEMSFFLPIVVDIHMMALANCAFRTASCANPVSNSERRNILTENSSYLRILHFTY